MGAAAAGAVGDVLVPLPPPLQPAIQNTVKMSTRIPLRMVFKPSLSSRLTSGSPGHECLGAPHMLIVSQRERHAAELILFESEGKAAQVSLRTFAGKGQASSS